MGLGEEDQGPSLWRDAGSLSGKLREAPISGPQARRKEEGSLEEVRVKGQNPSGYLPATSWSWYSRLYT